MKSNKIGIYDVILIIYKPAADQAATVPTPGKKEKIMKKEKSVNQKQFNLGEMKSDKIGIYNIILIF